MRRLFLGGLIVLILMQVVSAAIPGGIFVYNITINATTVNCSKSVAITAQVEDRTNGTYNIITSVSFYLLDPANAPYLGTGRLSATRIAGTSANGTWRAVLNSSPAIIRDSYYYIADIGVTSMSYPGEIKASDIYSPTSVNGMKAGDSGKTLPSAPYSAVFDFTALSTRQVAEYCICEPTVTSVSCGIDNILTTYYTIPAGCPGSSVSFSQTECDFCDPYWTAKYGSCTITDYSKMKGSLIKTYNPGSGTTPNGPYCCGKTIAGAGSVVFNHNGGSDCIAPPDNGGKIDCYADAWLNNGESISSTGKKDITPGWPNVDFDLSTLSKLLVTGGAKQSGGRQPVAFDGDYDGLVNVFQADSSTQTLYSIEMVSSTKTVAIDKSITINNYTDGQLSIYGVWYDKYGTGGFVCSDGTTGQCTVGVAVPKSTGVDFYLASSSSTFTLDQSVSLSGNFAGNGVSCYGGYCFIANKAGTLYRIDIDTWAVTSVSLNRGYSSVDITNVTPFFSEGPGGLSGEYVFVYGGANYSYGYINQVEVDTVTLTEYDYLDGLPAGAMFTYGVSGGVGPTLPKYSIYMTYTSLAGSVYSYLIRAYGIVASSFSSFLVGGSSTSILWYGYGPACLSNPAEAVCQSADSIAVQHYNGPAGNMPSQTPYVFSTGISGSGFTGGTNKYDLDSSAKNYRIGTNSVVNPGLYVNALDPEGTGLNQVWVIDTSFVLRAYNTDLSSQYSSYNLGSSVLYPPIVADINYDGKMEYVVFQNDGLHVIQMSGGVLQEVYSIVNGLTNQTLYPAENILYFDDTQYTERGVIWNTDKYPYVWKMVWTYSAPGWGYTMLNASSTFSYLPLNAGVNSYEMDAGRSLGGVAKNMILAWINSSNYDVTIYEYLEPGAFTFVRNYSLSKTGLWYGVPIGGAPFQSAYGIAADQVYIIDNSLNGGGILVQKGSASASCCQSGAACPGTSTCGQYLYAYSTSVFPLQIYQGMNCGGLGGGSGYVSCVYTRLDDHQWTLTNSGGSCFPLANTYLLDWQLPHPTSISQPLMKALKSCSSCGGVCYLPIILLPVVEDINGINELSSIIGAVEGGSYGKIWYQLTPGPTPYPGSWISRGNPMTSVPIVSNLFLYDFNGDTYTDVWSSDKIYYNNMTNDTASSLYYSSLDCLDSNTLQKVMTVPLPGSVCRSSKISAIEGFGNTDWSEVVSDKFYTFGACGNCSAGVLQDFLGKTAIPVGMESSAQSGFVATGPYGTDVYLPNVPATPVSFGANFTILRVQPCTYVNGVLNFGLAAVSPDTKLTYYMNPGIDSQYQSLNYPYGSSTYPFTFSDYRFPGNYTVKGHVCSDTLGTCTVDLTCGITVTEDDVKRYQAGGCDLGPSGEFNWGTTVPLDAPAYEWIYSGSAYPTIYPSSTGTLKLSNTIGAFSALHEAQCNKAGLTIKIKIKPSRDTEFKFSLDTNELVSTVEGYPVSISADAFQMYFSTDNNLYTYNLNSSTNILRAKYNRSIWTEYIINISIDSQKYTITDSSGNVLVNGEKLNVPMYDFWSSNVKMMYISGDVEVDYIRISGWGREIQTPVVTNLYETLSINGRNPALLDACDPARTKTFQSAKKSGTAGDLYPAVTAYCSSGTMAPGESAICDYETLKDVINYNSGCSKEVFYYCVDKTYPLGGSGTAQSGEGTTVCMAALGIGVTMDKVAFPLVGAIWKIFMADMWAFVLFVVFLIVVFAVFVGIRKGGR